MGDQPDPAPARSRRDEVAVAFFGSWMLFGLFLDGWAHEAEKPETFFSPWHGILYSGFVAAVAWFAVEGARQRRTGNVLIRTAVERVTAIGLVLFITGAVADGAWHEVFGIEVDLEALLSPTHLLLLIGGFLMVTAPIRAALADPGERAPSLRAFLPQVITMMLATALVSFFFMYLSAFAGVAGNRFARGQLREQLEVSGIASILVTNLILIAPLVFARRNWHPPAGSFTLLFSIVGSAMTGLDGFELIELSVAAVVGGIAADVLTQRRAPLMVTATVAPLLMWSAYLAVAHASYGIVWAPELWIGAVVLAMATGAILTVLTAPRAASAAT